MKKRFIKLFPKEVIASYDTLKFLRKSKSALHYHFLDNESFLEIDHPPDQYSIYWLDIIKRIHIIVLISGFKTIRWIEAIDDTINNYYGFCSSLRGLIE